MKVVNVRMERKDGTAIVDGLGKPILDPVPIRFPWAVHAQAFRLREAMGLKTHEHVLLGWESMAFYVLASPNIIPPDVTVVLGYNALTGQWLPAIARRHDTGEEMPAKLSEDLSVEIDVKMMECWGGHHMILVTAGSVEEAASC